MSVASRAPAFLLLGLVLLAAVLLIAGYGAAVGIGLIVGLLLGLAAILAFLAMRPRSGGGSSYAILSAGQPPNQPDHELIQRHHHDWMRVAGVDASALRRVIPVGMTVEAAGVRVELVVVEIREDGGIATFVSHARPPVGQVGHFIAVAVTDDAGTSYAASGQGLSGGNIGTSRHDVRFAPAPLPDALALTIRIDSFVAPYPEPIVQLVGPWEFRIPL